MKDYYTIETAKDPNTSPDILRKILEKENYDGNYNGVSWLVANNPNCPPEALKMVLERGYNDWASVYATQNPNCPPLAKILWMRATGRIGIENPKKHIIEYEEVKEDTDLQKLRELRDLIV